MTYIVESREFFLRNKVVNSGSNRDREIGFPLKYKVKKVVFENGLIVEKYVDVFNRFLDGNIPSSTVWGKLLHSLVFKFDIQDDLNTIAENTIAIEQLGVATQAINVTVNQLKEVLKTKELSICVDHTANSRVELVLDLMGLNGNIMRLRSVEYSAGDEVGSSLLLTADLDENELIVYKDLNVQGDIKHTGTIVQI